MFVVEDKDGTIFYFNKDFSAALSHPTALNIVKKCYAVAVVDKNKNTIEKTKNPVQDYIEAYFCLEELKQAFGKEKIDLMIEQAATILSLQNKD